MQHLYLSSCVCVCLCVFMFKLYNLQCTHRSFDSLFLSSSWHIDVVPLYIISTWTGCAFALFFFYHTFSFFLALILFTCGCWFLWFPHILARLSVPAAAARDSVDEWCMQEYGNLTFHFLCTYQNIKRQVCGVRSHIRLLLSYLTAIVLFHFNAVVWFFLTPSGA